MKTSAVFIRSLEIREDLKAKNDFGENRIDNSMLPVLPFRISTDVKLILIGQDPTVKSVKSRLAIEYTLNLDKNGSLKNYVAKVAAQLGLKLENVYATNVFKYFYSTPPERTMHVLYSHLDPNLRLLREEISEYPRAIILTLGLPVLRLLSDPNAEVHKYWDYDKKTKKSLGRFASCPAEKNKLGRVFFPLPHQPSLVKAFYGSTIDAYLQYVRKAM